MTLDEIIQILTNRLATLSSRRADMVTLGDLDAVATIDAEVIETQATLDQLKSLS